MKEKALKKINKMGKVGGIIVIIMQVLIGIALVGTLAAVMVVNTLPKDLVRVKLAGDAKVAVNLEEFGVKFSDKDKQTVYDDIAGDNSSLEVQGTKYGITDVNVYDSAFDLSAKADISEITLRTFTIPIVTGMIYLAMAMVTLVFAGKLCKALKVSQSPFDEAVIKKMRMLAFSLIPWVFLSSILDSVSTSVWTGNSSFSLSVNADMVFVVLIVLGLVEIFKYGAILQRESDETL